MRSLRTEAAVFPIALVTVVLVLLDFAILWVEPGWAVPLLISTAVMLLVSIYLSLLHAGRLSAAVTGIVPEASTIASGRLSVSAKVRTAAPAELRDLINTIDRVAEKQTQDFEAMQRLERVRSEFLANVSHELRTPIFAVQGFIETLLDGAVNDPKVNRDFLERAHIQSERLNSLLNDLIDISRIESGEMRMSFRTFDIQPFFRDLVSEMRPTAAAKGIELYLTGNIKPQSAVNVFADKDRVKQVMVNLVDNAIKYSDEGAKIKIELVNSEKETDPIKIRVSDTGIGIAPEHLPRLFERFYRVDKGRARSAPGGTGLGLAIVKHIVEAHHGSLSVESTPGKGSTFQFALQKLEF